MLQGSFWSFVRLHSSYCLDEQNTHLANVIGVQGPSAEPACNSNSTNQLECKCRRSLYRALGCRTEGRKISGFRVFMVRYLLKPQSKPESKPSLATIRSRTPYTLHSSEAKAPRKFFFKGASPPHPTALAVGTWANRRGFGLQSLSRNLPK